MVHGWVIVDKPEGMSSAHVVAAVRRIFNTKKAGHGGTLDPLASGVLPVALGEATKALSYILDGTKAYQFEVTWGETRTTDDREGDVTATSSRRPTREDIEAILPRFRGEIEQVPPVYSALKIGGKRAYALAREGKKVELSSRLLTIISLELVAVSPDSATFDVVCSKGTYVRSLGRDIAICLGTYGYISCLRRTQAGPFYEKNAILLDSLRKIGHNSELMKSVLPLPDALADILALEVEDEEALKLRQGQLLLTSDLREDIVLIMCQGIPQALAKRAEGKIKPLRVFNL
jgi:tRNA pseudouridine55 synthase